MNLQRIARILASLFLALTLSLVPGGGLVPGLSAEEKPGEAFALLQDLANQLGASQGDLGSRANNAAWEDTATFLQKRFGSGGAPGLPATTAGTEGISTWTKGFQQGVHGRAIKATWDRAKGNLEVVIRGEANGLEIGQNREPVGDYLVHIRAKVVRKKDEKGNPILRAQLLERGAVLSLAVGCDAEDQIDFNGRWRDNQGREWVIEHTPFKCGERHIDFTLTRTTKHGYKVAHTGHIINWQIKVTHSIEDPKAIEEPPQEWVRQEIASGRKGRARYVITLSPQFKEDGTMFLGGTFKGYEVKWNPDEKVVRDVYDGYEKPLALSQVTKAERYRIVRVEGDTYRWKSRLLGLQGEIGKIEREIRWDEGRLKEAQAKLENLNKQKPQVMEELSRKLQEIVDQESSLKLPVRPPEISADLKQKLIAQDDYERQIKTIEAQQNELAESKPPNWSDLYSAKETIRKDRLQRLAEVKSQIEKEYAKIGFDPEKEQEKRKRQLKHLKDEYDNLRKTKLTPLDSNLKDTARIIENLQKGIKQQGVRLTDLLQKFKELDPENTPLINRVLVFDSQGREIGRWEAWAPFEALRFIDGETERLRQRLEELRPLKEESQEQFQQAAQEARQALDQVTKAIMNSAYLQAGIEFIFYTYDVGKAWVKGGPPLAFLEGSLYLFCEGITSTATGEGIIEESDPQKIAAVVEEKYGFNPSRFPEIEMNLAQSSGLNWLLKDVIFDPEDLYLIPQKVHQYLEDHLEKELKSGLSEINTAKIDLEALEIKTGKLKNLKEQLRRVKANPLPLTDYAKGFVKEFGKSLLKRGVREWVEDPAWANYFQKDLWARWYFWYQQQAAVLYWQTYDKYMAWQQARNELVKGYDPTTGFKEIKSKLLREGHTYGIGVEFQNPRDLKEKVWLGIKEAGAQGAGELHRFRIQAVNLKPNNEKGDVVLKIEVQ